MVVFGRILHFMARPLRKNLGGTYYHVLNRANGRLRIFKKRGDFLAFEEILGEGVERFGMRICGYCVMGNHWHLLLHPREDGDLSEFMRWVGVTHTMRYHYSHGTAGTGHVYQGRFKSFPVQGDGHLLTVLRYIEANPLRAELVDAAEDYEWSSYREHVGLEDRERGFALSDLPMALPAGWKRLVHRDVAQREADAIVNAIKRGAPLGDETWIEQAVKTFGLQTTINKRGRPKKES